MITNETMPASQVDAIVTRCPFCNTRRSKILPGESEKYYCGTVRYKGEEDYNTGTQCNETAFRVGFVACVDALRQLLTAVDKASDWDENTRVGRAIQQAESVLLKHCDNLPL